MLQRELLSDCERSGYVARIVEVLWENIVKSMLDTLLLLS